MKPSKALTINKHEAQLRVYWGQIVAAQAKRLAAV
jgi:hypothetical protein